MREVSLKLPDPILRKLQLLARKDDVSIGQIVREAIERELQRRSVPPPPDPNENVVQAHEGLRAEMDAATGWHDLARRLRAHGCFVAEHKGDVVVKRFQNQEVVCRIVELGASYEALCARFKAPIPGPRQMPAQERVFASVRAPDPALARNEAMN